MVDLEPLLKKLMLDVVPFVRHANGLKLRRYQEAVARAVVRSVVDGQGLSFVVILPRQSGKNELQAQLQAYLLMLFSGQRAEIVQVSPTWKPQTMNAMYRLEATLSSNLVVKDRWEKHYGHVYQVGGARIAFLSGSPSANIVGATADLLLSVDEAQDIQVDKYDKEIAPMAASTNATRVFWGTAWTSNTLLAREEKTALALQQADGVRRVWRLTCEDVAREVSAYGAFVADQVERLGRNHPMVRTQYYSEDVDAQGGLFPPQRLDSLRGVHPPQVNPQPGGVYVMALDVAGEDEEGQNLAGQAASRDATALTIAQVDLGAMGQAECHRPAYRIVQRQLWAGVKHSELYTQLLATAAHWKAKYLVCDATGIGAGLTSFLARSLGARVIPFVFSAKSKSDLGWSFLSLIDSGRLKDFMWDETHPAECKQLQDLFFCQLSHCQYEIQPGPEKRIQWGVPDGSRDLASGELIHDDLAISAALLSLLDDKSWSLPGPTAIVHAADPLDDMKGF
jgi:muconolactone delta-isomerase